MYNENDIKKLLDEAKGGQVSDTKLRSTIDEYTNNARKAERVKIWSAAATGLILVGCVVYSFFEE